MGSKNTLFSKNILLIVTTGISIIAVGLATIQSARLVSIDNRLQTQEKILASLEEQLRKTGGGTDLDKLLVSIQSQVQTHERKLSTFSKACEAHQRYLQATYSYFTSTSFKTLPYIDKVQATISQLNVFFDQFHGYSFDQFRKDNSLEEQARLERVRHFESSA